MHFIKTKYEVQSNSDETIPVNKQIERQNTPVIRSKSANISPFRSTFRDRGIKAISSLLALLAMLEPCIAHKLKQTVYNPLIKRS